MNDDLEFGVRLPKRVEQFAAFLSCCSFPLHLPGPIVLAAIRPAAAVQRQARFPRTSVHLRRNSRSLFEINTTSNPTKQAKITSQIPPRTVEIAHSERKIKPTPSQRVRFFTETPTVRKSHLGYGTAASACSRDGRAGVPWSSWNFRMTVGGFVKTSMLGSVLSESLTDSTAFRKWLDSRGIIPRRLRLSRPCPLRIPAWAKEVTRT